MLDLFLDYGWALHSTLMVLTGIAMLRLGGSPERWIAIIGIGWVVVAHRIYHHLAPGSAWSPTFHAASDGFGLIMYLAVALRANRLYPLVIAALQLVSVLAYVAWAIDHGHAPISLPILAIAPSWGILVCMIVGIVAHVRRGRRLGSYPDWTASPIWPRVSA
ncbi:hypothetical protein [Altererythrobacter sp.]|uniref:hypothetical protein n=1 Tax=Altererythrobacter sp. TaxID=1872480 RepID=UPI003D0D5F16